MPGRPEADVHAGLLRDVAHGLSRSQKELPPKYFYDRRGSELFDEITRLPEYYLTRTERTLLDCWSGPLMARLRPAALVELGAGSADKTRLLLDAMVYAGSGELYVPIDVSAEFLDDAAARLRDEYPSLGVEPVVGDIADPLDLGDDAPRPGAHRVPRQHDRELRSRSARDGCSATWPTRCDRAIDSCSAPICARIRP